MTEIMLSREAGMEALTDVSDVDTPRCKSTQLLCLINCHHSIVVGLQSLRQYVLISCREICKLIMDDR
jgi:hypothetical protein